MTTRLVLPTDDSLINGQPIPRAYIAQLDAHFSQIFANLIGAMDSIIYNNDIPAGARINAAKEMRFLLDQQMKLLNDIERRQDAQEMENKSKNLRQMVSSDPIGALSMIDNELKKLNEFRLWVSSIVNPVEQARLPSVFKSLPDSESPF